MGKRTYYISGFLSCHVAHHTHLAALRLDSGSFRDGESLVPAVVLATRQEDVAVVLGEDRLEVGGAGLDVVVGVGAVDAGSALVLCDLHQAECAAVIACG